MNKTVIWGVVSTIAAAVIVSIGHSAFSVPSQIAVVQERQDTFEKRLNRFDEKLDTIIERIGGRR